MQTKLIDSKDSLKDIAYIESMCFAKPWTIAMLESSFCSGCKFVIAVDGDKVVGYGGLYPNGDITNIAVLKESRGQRIGDQILAKIIETAHLLSLDCILLEVRVSNTVAISLYEKHRFKQIDLRKKYYEDGEDALVYCLEVIEY